MKPLHYYIIAILIFIILITLIIEFPIYRGPTALVIPSKPYVGDNNISHDLPEYTIGIVFNGAVSSRDVPLYLKQGQNLTLVANITSIPTNLPVSLDIDSHVGFTKTNGVDSKLSTTKIKTPEQVMIYVSASKDATPNTYGIMVKANNTLMMMTSDFFVKVVSSDEQQGIIVNPTESNLENYTGIVSLENQTYYFVTPNYAETSYVHPVQIAFHDVNFTLFPPGFRGGLPVGGCPGQYYWVDVKFADGTAELLHIYAGSQSCTDSVPIMLSNHIIPQAGLAFSDGKMRLLVRDENQAGKDIVLQKPSSMVKPFPLCNQNPAKEKLIREKQQILTDALLADEKKYGGFENRTQNLPWSFIGYDCVDNALEVGILPQYFNSDLLPKYFEKIRSIVGNTIDVVLSPEEYATPI